MTRVASRRLVVLLAGSSLLMGALPAPALAAGLAPKAPARVMRGAGPALTQLSQPRSRVGPKHSQKKVPAQIQPLGSAQRKAAARSGLTVPPSRPAATAGSTAAPTTFGGTWTALGPTPIQNLDTYGNVSGRITALAVDPSSSGAVVYAGTAGGGVWKSVDAGTTWVPLTDSQPSLAIGALAIDPNNSQIIYAATGEANRCGDCQDSEGILKSIDGGASWTLNARATFGGGGIQVSSLVVDRSNSNNVFAATNAGLVESTDGGVIFGSTYMGFGPNASLNALSRIQFPEVDAIIQDPSTPSRFYAAVSERCSGYGFIAVSTDSGVTWPSANAGNLIGFASLGYPKIARIGLAAGPNGVLYASLSACPAASTSTSPAWSDGQLVAILKSTTGGVPGQWTRRTPDATLPDYFLSGPPNAPGTPVYNGWYANVVAVNPLDTAQAVFGGSTLIATKDGGATFTDIGRSYQSGPLHPDLHAIAMTGASSFYAGTDGGVWSTADFGGTGAAADWKNLNATLAITQFYSGSALDRTHMIGGSQDNATDGIVPGGPATPAWRPLLYGDGTLTAMDPTPGSNVIYGETPFGGIWKGTTASTANPNFATWQYAGPCNVQADPACSEPAEFVAPFVMNQTQPLTLYAATNRVYRTTTGGVGGGAQAWTPVSPDLTTGTTIFSTGDDISAMAMDGADTIVTGSFGGAIWITTNATASSPTWSQLNTSPFPAFDGSRFTGESWITSLAVKRGEVWATVGVHGVGRIWENAYAGARQWNDLTGNLAEPGGLLTAVTADSLDGGSVYVGTQAGAFMCGTCDRTNLIPDWVAMGTGLPQVRVDAITLTNDGASVIAWSHGRGAFSIPHASVLSATPSSRDFGSATVSETTASQGITVTEVGTSAATNIQATITGLNPGDFAVGQSGQYGCGPLLRLDSSCSNFPVSFSPTAAGQRSATLRISDSRGGLVTVALSGIGLAATVQVSAATIAFGDTALQTSSLDYSVTLTNTGSVNFHARSWDISGPNRTEFSSWTSGCYYMPPNGTCQILVKFTPQSVGNNKSAMLTIVDNAAGSPQQVSLTGNGVIPTVTYSPTSINFGDQVVRSSQFKVVVFTNNGPGDFVITTTPSLTGANAGDFSVGPCSSRAVPGQTCQVPVTFSPTALGIRTATLSITDDANGSPHTVTLSGNGIPSPAAVSPSSVAVGGQPIGTTVTRTVTIKNNGTTALNIFNQVVSDMQAEFTITATTCRPEINMMQGATCTVTLEFKPRTAYIDNGSLQIYDSAPDNVQSVPLSGVGTGAGIQYGPGSLAFGTWGVGNASSSQTVSVVSVGDSPLTVAASADGDFHAGNNCPTNLAQGFGCTITVTFTPTAAGTRTGTLTITDNAADSPQTVALSGTGATPVVAINPTTIDFGNGAVGQPGAHRLVTIQNTGVVDLHFSAISAGGDFGATDNCLGFPLHPGLSCTVTVAFTATAIGPRSATLTIRDDAANSPQTVPLTGTGTTYPTGYWENLGGSLSSSPAATSWGASRVDLFARGQDLALYHKWSNDGNAFWQPWERLGGTLSSDPTAVSWGTNRLDVFARGQDLALYHQYSLNGGTTWSGWIKLGGTLASNAAASTWGPNRIDLFAAGQNKGLYHMSSTNGITFTPWQALGGTLSSDPAAASWGTNRIDVFARGQDLGLYRMYTDDAGLTWHWWAPLGGTLSSSPAATSWGVNRIDLFALGQDKNMYHKWTSDGITFNDWQPLGGPWTLIPTAASRAVGVIDVFARGPDTGLWHQTINGS